MERRQFIAGSAIAALSISTLPLGAASTNGDRAQWERALRAYKDAEAKADHHYNTVWIPLDDKAQAAEEAAGLHRRTPGFLERRDFQRANPSLYYELGEASKVCDRLGDACADALCAVMDTTAPDLAAIRWKLEQFRDHRDGTLQCYTADFIEQTYADLARLLPPAG